MRGHGSKQRGFRAKGGDGRGEGVGRVQVERLGHSVRTEESWEMQ